MEPVWGKVEDAAGPLRANCILALPQCSDLRRFEIFRRLVDSLMDPLDPVRLEAVRAIEQMNGDEAPLLLRLKARVGDLRPAVTGCAFDAILHLESEKGLAFVSEFLKSSDPEVRDEAALAMGVWRHAKAIEILIATWKNTMDREFRSVLLRAISSSREESALEFLFEGTPGRCQDSKLWNCMPDLRRYRPGLPVQVRSGFRSEFCDRCSES
jgi:HEAT repeat protein